MSASPAFLEFRSVRKTYDQRTMVVRDFNLDVQRGEFVTLLGPSGSGKTTVLMMLAGFEGVTGGSITVDGHPITRTPPYKRNIGMVFQNYALFPHMSVAGNLAYPLRLRKLPRAQIEARVKQYLKLIELEAFGERQPGQLSGGQRQRVALARALIFEPTLVLMDEPLGALDKKLREQMQFEITRLHEELGFTVIYVTHDQTEALTMSSRIAVFNQGVVQQFAAPSALYETPANAFVASFIGENNLIPATGIALENECGIGEIVWSTVFAYNKDTIGAKVPTSLKDLFDTQGLPGKRALRKRAQVNLEWALLADGVPADQVYTTLATSEGQQRAFDKLATIRDDIVWFDSWSQAPQLLNDGGAIMVQSANGRFFDAINREKKPFVIVWDGNVFDLDAWGIVKGTPRKDLALDFVRFTTSTKALAGFQDVAYGPPRKSSMALVDPAVVEHLPSTHVDKGIKADGIFWADYGETLGEKFNEWLLQ